VVYMAGACNGKQGTDDDDHLSSLLSDAAGLRKRFARWLRPVPTFGSCCDFAAVSCGRRLRQNGQGGRQVPTSHRPTSVAWRAEQNSGV
ncbi:hypothetical protein, partial [Mesorhizobium sp. M2A.F.Ca.ET.015.02.1.1]|uniref:hypothetical protein n=1 Tax=Mesorhizobium sp. M2A.F.Ca.ET.015.02.1.1 TaxID=2496758 RepID=UPI001AEC9A63